MEKFKKNAIVGQSGGPTAAINATLSGIIEEAISSEEIGALWGMKNGLEGLLQGRTTRLDKVFCRNEERLSRLSLTPAAALGSCRVRLPDPLSERPEDVGMYEQIRARLCVMDVSCFWYIGGNDSMDTVDKLNRYARRVGWQAMHFIGVPKTVDNDLAGTDHTPGFGSAAKYVATVTGEILCDCAVYTKPSVTVIEVMGRDAGWLTAASALGRLSGGSEPDFVYLPEHPFRIEDFLEDVGRALQRHPNVVVAVSEGIRLPDGRYVGAKQRTGESDSFGHRFLGGVGRTLIRAVKERFGCKTRAVELNLPQRCVGHLLSATDIRESK
ncbi:MAG: diphosphate--fructose-6-phosphate 1-phosphotransferase, partial [Clostridia bacterium]|nr:diphosphate--fructose-6-phosphate 1-phosphotransferase [Clostridia bacterium]